MRRVRFILAACAFLASAGVANAQGAATATDEQYVAFRQENCGDVYPVESYRADIGDLRIELTANARLVVNGRVIAEYGVYDGRPPAPWEDSANGASIGWSGPYILVETISTDCIDYDSARIFVLDRDGALRATSRVWSMNDRWSGFSRTNSGLMYSSAWFCSERGGAPPGRAFVFVLRLGAREFVREERPWTEVCQERENRPLPENAVYLSPMQPIAPAGR